MNDHSFYFAMMFLLKGACKDCYPTERATIAHAHPCSSNGHGGPNQWAHCMPRPTNKSKLLSSHHSTIARNKCSIPVQAVQYLHVHGDTFSNPWADCWHAPMIGHWCNKRDGMTPNPDVWSVLTASCWRIIFSNMSSLEWPLMKKEKVDCGQNAPPLLLFWIFISCCLIFSFLPIDHGCCRCKC